MTYTPTPEQVEAFKKAWHEADAEGDTGNRTLRGLTAAGTLIERAVRERVAQEIEAARTRPEEFIKGDRRRRAKSRGHANFNAGMTRAASIVRGDTP